MKCVRCDECHKPIKYGEMVVLWSGYTGIFCSRICAFEYYASSCLSYGELNDELAETKMADAEEL